MSVTGCPCVPHDAAVRETVKTARTSEIPLFKFIVVTFLSDIKRKDLFSDKILHNLLCKIKVIGVHFFE